MSKPLLQVENLKKYFRTKSGILHAVDDVLRSRLIPMNKVYNIAKVLESLRKFPLQERRRILFEYLVIKNINDDLQSAKKLVKLLHGFKAKVNLIPFNPHEESDFQRPENEERDITRIGPLTSDPTEKCEYKYYDTQARIEVE